MANINAETHDIIKEHKRKQAQTLPTSMPVLSKSLFWSEVPVNIISSEVWLAIPGFESLYEVSDMGRVRRKPNTPSCKNGRLLTIHYRDNRPYGSVALSLNNRLHQFRIDELVLRVFVGEQPVKTQIIHLNNDMRDNHLSNLAYQPIPQLTEKHCTKCGRLLPLTPEFFESHSGQSTGFRPDCRDCHRIVMRSYTASHREELTRKARERYAVNPEPRRITNRKYVERHRNRVRLRSRLSSQRHPRNKQKDVIKRLNRHARKRSLPNTFTASQWQRALSYFKGCCAVCGSPRGLWSILAADHWIALNDSRPDNPGSVATNIVPLCHPRKGIPIGEACCNTHKGDQDALSWLTQRFGKRKAHEINARIQDYFAWVREQDEGK